MKSEVSKFLHSSLTRYRWVLFAAELKRRILRHDEKLRAAYLRSASPSMLQIGGGWRRLDGWLNTDLARIPGVMKMDATKPFPFSDHSFDLVYSEHMIEHISYRNGAQMLTECWRVLRPGGALRLVTPNLDNLIALALPERSDIQTRYLNYFSREFLSIDYPPSAVGAINAHFRLWGHSFLYDEATLAAVMTEAGFVAIARSSLQSSVHTEFLGVANAGRYPEGLLEYESLVLEALKPESGTHHLCPVV